MIPFSPPDIYDEVIPEVVATLKSGWITTGPRTKDLEKKLADYTGASSVLCLNSATAGLELVLRWFGVGPGDEVIVPVYTYCASANVILHCGAKPVMVDCTDDFNIDTSRLPDLITERTKVIIPVDFAGYPCDYDAINRLVSDSGIRKKFRARGEVQKALGRILVLSDAAHSIGSTYKGKRAGLFTDITVFSFHAVKNLTTAEGGAVCLNIGGMDPASWYASLSIKALHGQNKDALAKTQAGNWKYDIVEAGYKWNMTDIQAALGLVGLRNYESRTLPARKKIFEMYDEAFRDSGALQLPVYRNAGRTSSYHLYALRVKGISAEVRDAIMKDIFSKGVSVNVHFPPLPMLSVYRDLGYSMADYPTAMDCYSREISLPVYVGLSDENVGKVVSAVLESVETHSLGRK